MSVNDTDSEYRLLAALVDEPDYILKISEELFTEERRALYRAMRECFLAYGAVSDEGVELYFGKPVPQQVDVARGTKPLPVIEKLTNVATKRQLWQVVGKLDRIIDKPFIDIDEVRQALEFTPILAAHDTTIVNGVLEFISDLNRKRNGTYQFVRTGLDFLDSMLGGEWPRQALTVVLGQAGGGKTALVCNSMINMARLDKPIPSFFASLEMTKARLISRLVANLKRIDGLKLRTGAIDGDDMKQVDAAIEELQTLPLYIDDRPRLRVADIVAQMRDHKDRYNAQVVFIDYLQIINHEQGDNQSETLGQIAQQIRNAAVELDMAAVLLSQQNRAFQGLQSILGSGRVGHIADTVFEIKNLADSSSDDYRIVTFDFLKNRDGPLGQQTVQYLPRYLAFTTP